MTERAIVDRLAKCGADEHSAVHRWPVGALYMLSMKALKETQCSLAACD